MNKSLGFDFLSNEFFKFRNSEFLVGTIRTLCNSMAMTGHVHKNFNISIIKSLTKKSDLSSLSDYRPISISLVICSIFEKCLLSELKVLENIHYNQFGYKHSTSCKSAYYVVNEAINFSSSVNLKST